MNAPHPLIEAYLDGELTPVQAQEFFQWLQSHPDHARHLLIEAHLHRSLIAFVRMRRLVELPEATSDLAFPSAPLERAHWPGPDTRWHWRPALLAGLALLFFLSLLALSWLWLSGPRQPSILLVTRESPASVLQPDNSRIEVLGQYQLQIGDQVFTGPGAAALQAGKDEIHLQPGSHLTLLQTPAGSLLVLEEGALHATIKTRKGRKALQFATPLCLARVLGTEFQLESSPNSSRLEVYEGTVRLERRSTSEAIDIRGGFYSEVQEQGTLTQRPLPSGEGRILWEFWLRLPGSQVRDLQTHPRFQEPPDGARFLTRFEAPSNWADNYGARVRGWIHPPRTGNYTFWISGDDAAELWLSSDRHPEHMERICHTPSFTAPRSWDQYPEQKSRTIRLTGGKKYYIEALHKEGGGADGLAVAWEGPNLPRQIIAGPYLSPPANTELAAPALLPE
jgi:ferric-dicitrate binding protein FerR (iron transport regulator)